MVASFFDGPVFSILLCLLAGIALRYAIYHGRDSLSDDEPSRLAELEEVNHEYRERQYAMQQALDNAMRTENQLRTNIDRLLADAETLRSEPSSGGGSSATEDAALRQRISELEQDVSLQESMLRELRLQKEEVLTHLERERNERRELEQTVAETREPWQHARSNVDPIESLLERATFRQLTVHDCPERPYAEMSSNHVELQETPQILAFTTLTDHPINADDYVIDPARGLVYERPPHHRDDLRRISGIGEILSARLNGLGVYTYKQVMQWEPRHVREFSRLLSFRDRIEREQWVAQARRLYQESQGEAA